MIRPSSPRMGAALSSMGRSVPSFATSTVWLASPWILPVAITVSTGLVTGSRVVSSMMTKTASSGLPLAWAMVQPVNSTATAFMKTTRPAKSVAMTASPMLLRVVENHSPEALRPASTSFCSEPSLRSRTTSVTSST